MALMTVLFSVSVLVYFWHARGKSLHVFPLSLWILLGWIIASTAWSVGPGDTFKRGILTVLTTFLAYTSAQALGVERTIKVSTKVLIFLCIVSFLSCLVVKNAIHQPGDAAEVVGDWRGLFPHKNNTGAYCVIALLALVSPSRPTRPLYALLLALPIFGLLVMTGSKTSLFLFIPALLVLLAVNKALKLSDGKITLMKTLLVMIAFSLISGTLLSSYLIEILNDPTTLTNRAMIWQVLFAAIGDRPLQGVGFSAFWNTPSNPYVTGQFVYIAELTQGHNGYIDVTAAIGLVGLILALFALFVVPVRDGIFVWRAESASIPFLFSVISFFFMHNFTESSLLRTSIGTWLIFCLIIGCTYTARLAIPGKLPRQARMPFS
ncbi:O-antigen ligase family protein [Novosphingobium sp. SL115]|uniref:O-antigen ligase family protein n=1 Tax=Novosphingobium sp. SL115 TaxID=2995150 RepID=UPI00227556EE|nr:O-antigen ligase family protein [Novosphingobium sp. SL115]MCY1669470.1 O-antigen ligase family protein [Novosphingobium sp. SL115]